jgi:hypothetical protein
MTLVLARYRCAPSPGVAGPIVNWPPSSSSSEPKIGAESKRGMQHHTIAPSRRT